MVKKGSRFVLFLYIVFFTTIALSLAFYRSSVAKKKNVISAKAKTIKKTPVLLAKKPPFDSTLLAKYFITEAVLLGSIDHVSYYFHDLNSNTSLKMEPERAWIPASTIKAFVVLEAFRQKDLGMIDFNQTITVDGKDVVPTAMETDEFPRLLEGTQVTIRQLVETMIIQSDNTAFNVLLDILDRRNINAALKSYGLTETIVGEKLSLDDGQFAIDLTTPGRQSNTTTAKDLATLYILLYNHTIPHSEEIIAIFKRQKFNNMIPAHIPSNVEIAHKTGAWDPYYHDGGIVYKPSQPFIFAAFSDSGNPEVIAKIARVAYYQSADVVGKPVAAVPVTDILTDHNIYYLSEATPDTEVLGATTNSKFPAITAQDLGITHSDFGINPAFAAIINKATILPGSLLFPLKRLVENVKVALARDPNGKAQAYLGMANSRISEAKTLLAQKKFSEGYELLNQSGNYLKSAVNENEKNKDLTSVETKQLSDLRFSLLSETVNKMDTSQKMQLIDVTYNLYKKYETDIAPHIASSRVTNPTQQKPTIGTVTAINGNTATMKLDDGTTKQALITHTTPLRDFQHNTVQSASRLTVGSQISIIGTISSNGVIIPRFILNNVPKELPKAREGKVIEVNPNTNTLTITNAQGKQDVVTIDKLTLLKSRDTNVSLEGIKAGSHVSIFGTTNPTVSTAKPTTSLLLPTHPFSDLSITRIITGSQTKANTNTSSQPATNPHISPQNSQTHKTSTPNVSIPVQQTVTKPNIDKSQGPGIKATSLTVIGNTSGNKELAKPPPQPAREKQKNDKPSDKSKDPPKKK